MTEQDDILRGEIERAERPKRKGRPGSAAHLKAWRFQKGKSGNEAAQWKAGGESPNPGGRPGAQSPLAPPPRGTGKTTYYLKRFARKRVHAEAIARAIIEGAKNPKSPHHAKMVDIYLTRTEGAPTQKIAATLQTKQIQLVGLTTAELKKAGIKPTKVPTLDLPPTRIAALVAANKDPGAPPEERPADPNPVNGHAEPAPDDAEEEDEG